MGALIHGIALVFLAFILCFVATLFVISMFVQKIEEQASGALFFSVLGCICGALGAILYLTGGLQ